jgi:hypothetical protein
MNPVVHETIMDACRGRTYSYLEMYACVELVACRNFLVQLVCRTGVPKNVTDEACKILKEMDDNSEKVDFEHLRPSKYLAPLRNVFTGEETRESKPDPEE